MNNIYTYSRAIRFLRTRGTKVALQVKADGPYIFAEKRDFLRTLQQLKSAVGPTNYGGGGESFWIDGNVLHVPAGIL